MPPAHNHQPDRLPARTIGRRGFNRALGAGAAVAAGLAGAPLRAQDFPTRPLRLIVPYGPGAASDYVARLVAEKMSVELGQTVLVENKPAGLGLPAINDVLNAPADGHVMLAADSAHWAITPAMQAMPYDFLRDFQPLSLTFSNGLLLFVNTSSGITSLQGLLAEIKAKPGQFNYGTPGIGSLHHLAMEVLKTSLGLDCKHIPYRGGADAIQSLLRGETQIGINSQTAVVPHVISGKLRILAVTVTGRLRQLPDIPTVAEVTGLRDFQFPGQQGLVVKAGTPKAVVDRLSAAIRKAGSDPVLAAKVLERAASEMAPMSPEQLTELIRSDIRRYAAAVKVSGASTQ